jgi:mevalonate kinase
MKPLNKKERNKAFYKVVGLFLISFIIAILLGFTTMNAGRLSERQSKGELNKLKNHLKFQEEVFAPNVSETNVLLSKIPTSKETGENLEVLNQDIAALLSQTKSQIAEEESWETKMYQDVIQSLSNLQLALNNQIELREEMGDANSAGQKLQECIAERDRLQTQVNLLQAASSSGGGGGGGGANVAQLEKNLKEVNKELLKCNLENKALKQEIEKIRNR